MFSVFVDDNYHFMDESERYKLGEFKSFGEAEIACKRLVDQSLEEQYEPGITPEALLAGYKSYGDNPWITGGGFSAREYAEKRCREFCKEKSINF
jgi:hypothetical protein